MILEPRYVLLLQRIRLALQCVSIYAFLLALSELMVVLCYCLCFGVCCSYFESFLVVRIEYVDWGALQGRGGSALADGRTPAASRQGSRPRPGGPSTARRRRGSGRWLAAW